MSADGGHCIWYGAVHVKEDLDKIKNLVYNGPPKPMANQKIMEMFRENCPDMAKYNELCCDEDQAMNMISGFGTLEAVLSRCQNCMTNLKKILCEFNCSPRQSEFVKVLKTFPFKNG